MDKKALNSKDENKHPRFSGKADKKTKEVELLELAYLKKHRSYKYMKLFFRAKTRKHAIALKKVS